MMSLLIRWATRNDASLIADLSRQTFYETFAPFNTKENMDKFMNEQFTRELLMKEVGAAGNIFFIAFDGPDAVGYVRLRENNNPPELTGSSTLEIARIYSSASHIGKGVGRRLMEECLTIAGNKKVDFIWLGVWEKNQRAIEFYIKWGFEKFSTHVFLLGDDPQTDWLMRKRIES